MKLPVFSPDGSSSHETEFDAIQTFDGDTGLQALKEVIVAQEANARQGNASTKTRAEVSGGGKKPWRQKGTGNARAGSRTSPIWRGGGVVFGSHPRDYSKKINRKVKNLAFRRAFFERVTAGEVAVIETLEVSPAKTKAMAGIVDRIASKGAVLIVDDGFSEDVSRAARNISRITLREAGNINTQDLALFHRFILSRKAMERLLARMNGENS
ncbi:MAG: 50S ribosomal protein L4 [Opitutales bacterium]